LRRIIKIIIAFYYKFKFINKCKIHAFSNVILRKSYFEGKNALGKNTYFSNSSLGYASYIGQSGEFANCIIGKFCSIGNHVRVISGTHPVDGVISSHPAFYSDKFYFSYVKKSKYIEHILTDRGYECEIGNDVWIGDNVLIRGGVKISDGSIIGMGSIVLHDVPPYTVVAGIPAKPIRQRFTESIVHKLMEIKWWNMPHEWIKENASNFVNVEEFINGVNITDK